jgi:hypothetical protein
MLEPKKRVAGGRFFAQYRGCVFSKRNAPGSAELRVKMDLSLEELREPGPRHLPPTRLLRAPERAPDEIHSASVMYLQSQWGCLGGPEIVSIPDPCCNLSFTELTSRTLGTVQTLYKSLNQFISLGGNDHIDRLQIGSGRERSESRAGASTIADAT